MPKARKRVAKAGAARRKSRTKAKSRKAKTRKASTRKSKAGKTKARKTKSAAKRPARKRRPKQGIAATLASGVQVVADSFEESADMRRKMGTRTGIGEG